MRKAFVVVSGLPGSGKSTLAQKLAPALGLPLLDKDTILERLFEIKGIGDLAWRRALSRETDLILQSQAIASEGAILVSHWHVPGMQPNSGTPTHWLAEVPGRLVNVHCRCEAEIAAKRFVQRERHPGHLDEAKSFSEILESLRTQAALEPLNIGPRIDVDTSEAPNLESVLREIHEALGV